MRIQRGREDEGFRKDIQSSIVSGLLIFLSSVVLETIQYYLPYRTFNIYVIIANGCGVLLFMLVLGAFYLKNIQRKLLENNILLDG